MHTFVTLRRKLCAFSTIPDREFDVLAERIGKPRVVEAREELNLDQSWPHKAFLINDGWACTYKQLPSGARQIVDLAIPGDILGMRSLMLRNLDFAAAMITTSVVYEISSRTILELLDPAPRLAAGLLWSSSREEALLVERLVGVGRKTALQRVVHFFLELQDRLALVGKCNGESFSCPLNQGQIADALGLTSVHLNRIMRELRQEGVVNLKDGYVEFLDFDKAVEVAQYNPAYLDHVATDRRKRTKLAR
ncbi:Crp/Fnr family transcriptional regulator [Rhizobiales bacterium]|uniref:Crp/Fnr family transcriptional regulator n=1 Tax=Hongsoonwoonella zoysiae TaxID=2821844 RepID=UPI0015616253|nr:Crp/Fnr family transcriptional regulator [Hongsoonwoonella zoysiae]NRG16387.1 Crp/Fnr family transcriptional regulator [Hongsoonwoonella zoysiae]